MKSLMQKHFEDICRECNLPPDILEMFISEEWVSPFDEAERIFDEEDYARITLIQELRNEFGVNDEAVPIILNLLDQLHFLRASLRRLGHEQ